MILPVTEELVYLLFDMYFMMFPVIYILVFNPTNYYRLAAKNIFLL